MKTPININRQLNAEDYYEAFDKDLNTVGENGRTVLHRAAEKNNLSIVKMVGRLPQRKNNNSVFAITDELLRSPNILYDSHSICLAKYSNRNAKVLCVQQQ